MNKASFLFLFLTLGFSIAMFPMNKKSKKLMIENKCSVCWQAFDLAKKKEEISIKKTKSLRDIIMFQHNNAHHVFHETCLAGTIQIGSQDCPLCRIKLPLEIIDRYALEQLNDFEKATLSAVFVVSIIGLTRGILW